MFSRIRRTIARRVFVLLRYQFKLFNRRDSYADYLCPSEQSMQGGDVDIGWPVLQANHNWGVTIGVNWRTYGWEPRLPLRGI